MGNGNLGTIPTQKNSRSWSVLILKNRVVGVLIFQVLVMILFSFLSPNFLKISNINTIFLNACILAILTCAEAIVIITRNYDVSVASILALSAYIGFDMFAKYPEMGPVLLLVPIGIGAVCGLINGLIVAYGKVSSIFVTLGGMSIYRGIATIYANGKQIEPKDVPVWVKQSVTGEIFGGISALALIAVFVVSVITIYLRYTRTGRQIYAIGSNPDAARFYGLKVERITLQAYVLCGALTGLGGFLYGSRASYVVPWFAQGMEMQIIGAVVVGGVSVLGGSGNVVGAAFGAILLQTIQNGLILSGASEVIKQIIHGGAIVGACIFDSIVIHQVGNLLRSKKRRGGTV